MVEPHAAVARIRGYYHAPIEQAADVDPASLQADFDTVFTACTNASSS